MKTFLVAICVVLGVARLAESAIAVGGACSSSYTCGAGHCCRDANNKVISTAQGNGLHGGFVNLVGHRSGTCTAQKSQKGEMCDSSCQCDTGLACYQPVTGACCAAHTCVDEAYAKQQHQYWANCFANPKCALPP